MSRVCRTLETASLLPSPPPPHFLLVLVPNMEGTCLVRVYSVCMYDVCICMYCVCVCMYGVCVCMVCVYVWCVCVCMVCVYV